MTRTLRQPPASDPDPQPETLQSGEVEQVVIFDDRGQPFSFADLAPMSEDARRRLGFPFDVPDEFNDADARWIRERLGR